MSALFGKVCQNGYVVRDIADAMKFWTEVLRVGPFFYVPSVKIDWYRYKGRESPLEMSVALANSGDLQIELIQQRNDAPSLSETGLYDAIRSRTAPLVAAGFREVGAASREIRSVSDQTHLLDVWYEVTFTRDVASLDEAVDEVRRALAVDRYVVPGR